jgi:predicted xylose isomerase-like sugar epimerase
MLDPEVNNVRALAAQHGISIKRVDAILRLKGLEAAWKKVRICLSFLICTDSSPFAQVMSKSD